MSKVAYMAHSYNAPRYKNPLVCVDEAQKERADSYSHREDLGESVQSALRFHELTGANVFEFVAFSNLRLPRTVVLHNQVTLFPCFHSDPMIMPNDELADLTLRMQAAGRFIYDGWLPIDEWEPEKLTAVLRGIDEALSVFALQGPIWFNWEPKYPIIDHSSTWLLAMPEIEEVMQFTREVDKLSPSDRRAVYRSIGWLAQSVRLTDPAARFLFCILAIESLATYIERDAAGNMSLATLRTTKKSKAARRAERESCIKRALDEHLADDPTRAVLQAYFTCVHGIKAMVEASVRHVFAPSLAEADTLFVREGDDPSLYDLRNAVAHGSTDTLSELEREKIRDRVPEVELIAQEYVMTVLYKATGVPPLQGYPMRVSTTNFLNNLFSAHGMYVGPTHLAWVYQGAGPRPVITLPSTSSDEPS